jgi:F-type H+-transporting ATPase subunit delta
MTELAALARPYARAAFEYAQSEGRLSEWMEMFSYLETIISNPEMQKVLQSPSVTESVVVGIMKKLMESATPSEQNFVTLLAKKKRLVVLGEIIRQLKALVAKLENTQDVVVESVETLSPDILSKLQQQLEKRFNQHITIQSTINPDIIGGMVIRAGDLVIDKSIRNQLQRLRNLVEAQ